MNSLSIIGNVGRDVELRHLKDGKAVASFSVAHTSRGGSKDVTTWLNCSAFGKTAEIAAEYLKKGDKVALSGPISLRTYEKDGETRQSLDLTVDKLTLLGNKNRGEESNPGEEESDAKKSVEATLRKATGFKRDAVKF